jgi:nicotinamide mononucleotide (NMN) deamidase PncC
LTYVAVADAGGVEVRRFVWAGDRAANRESTARAALDLLLERLSSGGETSEAHETGSRA